MARNSRTTTRNAEETNTVNETVTPDVAESADQAIESAIAANPETRDVAKNKRPSLTLAGEVTVRPSTRDASDFTTRARPSDNNPVFLAVKAAPFDEPQDLVVAREDVETTMKLLRRAANPDKLNVGMNIAPGEAPQAYDTEGAEIPGKVVVSFIKRAERRKVTKRAAAEASAADGDVNV